MAYHYRVYGLHLETNRELSLLPAQTAQRADLVVCWTTSTRETPDEHLSWERVLTSELRQKRGITLFQATSNQGVFKKLRYDTAKAQVEFLLDPSRRNLWIIYSKDDSEVDLESYFVGPALGCVLRLCGTMCLHASVVNIDGQAVAIVGKKKAGKSTSAAGLAQLGAAVLSDDMAVLTPHNGHFLVQPGYPQVRLWPSSIEAIYPGSGVFPRVFTHRDKRYLPLGIVDGPVAAFWASPLPLAAIYLLHETADSQVTPHIESVGPRDKLMTLAANTFGGYVVTNEMRQKEFAILAQLSKTVSLRRLVFRHELGMLPEQSKAIIEDFRIQTRSR
jgi:hypothetical protein